MRTFIIIAIIFSFTKVLYSQVPAEEPKTLLYKKEFSIGAVIHSSGWGVFYRNGRHLTGTLKRSWDIEFVSLSSPKESSISSQYNENAKQYVYGRLNLFFILRTGIGTQKVLYRKPQKRGVEIRYFNFIGVSNGILKPIYLEIINPSSNPNQFTLTTEKYDPLRHFPDYNIFGRAAFTEGLEKIGYIPGGYIKCGLNFEFADYEENSKLRILEIGAVSDAYPKNVPIMAFNENSKFFLNVYLAFHLGMKKI